MNIVVKRFSESKSFGGSTLGILFIDGKFECYTLEDEAREVKVPGETRIPAGTYSIKLRSWGGLHEKYKTRFPDMHKGMLKIENVPGFTDIMIHCGATEKDTAGCLVVGDGVNNNQVAPALLTFSSVAYARLYPAVIEAIDKDEEIKINVEDLWDFSIR